MVTDGSAATVIIAAHNEEETIGHCLDGLLGTDDAAALRVIVAANGCTDRTAQIARQRRVTVLELPTAGKVAALNAAELLAGTGPRVYLDADIALAGDQVAALLAAVTGAEPAPMAAVPARRVEVSGRPRLVRMYYRVNALHPAYADGLFGRGAIAVSSRGRAAFERFPEVVADDLFLDSLFAPDEKVVVERVCSVVAAPLHTADLLRRLARVRRGNAQLRATSNAVRPRSGSRWLRAEVRRQPSLAPSAVAYAALTLLAAARARWGVPQWGQDAASRSAPAVRALPPSD